MQLHVYMDRSPYPWAPGLINTARARGIQPLGLHPIMPKLPAGAGYFFGRCEQNARHLDTARTYCMAVAQQPGIRSVISEREYFHYERKSEQAAEFARWMPDTFRCTRPSQVEQALYALGAPIISKSDFGSSSSNVRLLESHEEALLEASLAFSDAGLITERGRQKGYVLWQRYLPYNDYAYRVVRIGRWYWLLTVYNRDDRPMASGSGKFFAWSWPDAEARRVLKFAHDFCESIGTKWIGLDIIRDPLTGEWRLLETTLAWNLRAKGANEACAVIDQHGQPHPKKYHGRDQWDLLLTELEAGVWDN
jgi:hypothetical protein